MTTDAAHFGDDRYRAERELGNVLAEMHEHLDDAEHGLLDRSERVAANRKRWSLSALDLLRRARVKTQDGLPRGNGIGGGGSPRYAADGSRPGPTPGMATNGDQDVMLDHWRVVWRELTNARASLRKVVVALAEATPAPPKPQDGCRVCGAEEVYAGERCRWDYDFWLRWKIDTPTEIVEAHARGERITENKIRVVLARLTWTDPSRSLGA